MQSQALIQTRQLKAAYGDAQALFGVDFLLEAGEIISIVGANGAGKSTFLKALTGLLPVEPDSVLYKGQAIGGLPCGTIVQRGITMVPEGRRLFPSLNVEENLKMGAFARRKGPWSLQRVYRLFPALLERRRAPSGALSGGQQQMVAIGRALMSNPDVLLCDELSLGLAPVIVKEIYDVLPGFVADGMSLIIVEQDVHRAQSVSQRLYCFQEGKVSLEGRSAELAREQISQAYFGL